MRNTFAAELVASQDYKDLISDLRATALEEFARTPPGNVDKLVEQRFFVAALERLDAEIKSRAYTATKNTKRGR